jgi:hypothetical protein
MCVGSSGGLLGAWQSVFGLRKRLGISWPAERILASHEGLCSVVFVILMGISKYGTTVSWHYSDETVSSLANRKSL